MRYSVLCIFTSDVALKHLVRDSLVLEVLFAAQGVASTMLAGE